MSPLCDGGQKRQKPGETSLHCQRRGEFYPENFACYHRGTYRKRLLNNDKETLCQTGTADAQASCCAEPHELTPRPSFQPGTAEATHARLSGIDRARLAPGRAGAANGRSAPAPDFKCGARRTCSLRLRRRTRELWPRPRLAGSPSRGTTLSVLGRRRPGSFRRPDIAGKCAGRFHCNAGTRAPLLHSESLRSHRMSDN